MRIDSDFTFKDHLRESRLVNTRLIAAGLISLLVFAVIMARMVYLQVFEYEHFDSLATKNRVGIEALPPQRGLIYDRNGVVLAENIPTFSLEVVPEQVPNMQETLADLSLLLALSDEEVEGFRTRLKRHRRFEQVVLRARLSEEEVATFSVNRHRFPGVDVVGRLVRNYPHGALFSHAVGYVGRINQQDLQRIDNQNYKGTLQIGKTGVERYYEDTLHGTVGYRQVETNVQGRTVRELKSEPAHAGQDIYLHLDIELQRVAAEALEDYNGSIVAIDPRNGGVLAMVSKPDYDPNKFVTGISVADYAELRDSRDQPLYDRAIRGNYPPGSTIKPFVALAGLEMGITTPQTQTYCPGFYSLQGSSHRYRCWRRQGHAHVDVISAIAESCDVYFYDLARVMGIDRLHGFLDMFGFGKRTNIDVPNEGSGLSPSSQWKRATRNQPWYPGETLISGIGQGFNQTTPLQLAHATAILAMRGQIIEPRLIRATRSAAEQPLQLIPNPVVNTLPMQSAANWQKIIDAMIEVMHGRKGTARSSGTDLPFQIAGKTGTAQVFGLAQDQEYDATALARRLHDHALFVAFVPADNPEIAIAVVVENGGSGSGVAAPMARKVIDQYFGLGTDEPDIQQP